MVFCKDISQRQRIYLANKKLNQCNKMLENFSLIFSHDLIQPLRQATNFLTMIEEHLEPTIKGDTFVNHALTAIEKSLDQVRKISEGVALYCRNGNLTIDSEAVCLKTLIEEVRQSCLDDKKIEVKILIKESISLYANRVSLLQLFQNLLGNAVKHADSKRPIITLSGKKSQNNFYEILLHNNGSCPSHVKRSDLFKPFNSSKVDGAGLGLMICEKIVTAYKGKIGIKSSPTKGTTVFFTLPLMPDQICSGSSTVSIQ
jgi:light-regulated signal transduction histidine kinase (bacteriophytochrome)